MATRLECDECSEIFEVSNEIADAMSRWREASGDPYVCRACAGVANTFSALSRDPEIAPTIEQCNVNSKIDYK